MCRKIAIQGGKPLFGEIHISGAKNAAVAIIPATILSNGVCRLENIPDIVDVMVQLDIVKGLGAGVMDALENLVLVGFAHIRQHQLGPFFGKNLAENTVIRTLFAKYFRDIRTLGPRASLEAFLHE